MAILEGKVAVVTGAGRGIGKGIAMHMAREGAQVVVNDLGGSVRGEGDDIAVADQVVEEIKANGGEAVSNTDSVASWEGGQRIIQAAMDNFGRIDILVNNAGILRDQFVYYMSEEEWDAVIDVHLKGSFYCSRAAAPHMRDQKWGRLIFITSTAGFIGTIAQCNYGAAKMGMLGLSRLSGHAFYELSFEGGLRSRRFEISGTTRSGLKFEHIELAMRLAEALGAAYGLRPEPVTPQQVEAAYLRRLKVDEVQLGPPPKETWLPQGADGQPMASYRVDEALQVTMLYGGQDFAYAAAADPESGVLLRRNEARGVMAAMMIKRGRLQRGTPLMTTPLDELALKKDAAWNRALCAWAAWLVSQKG